MHDGIEVGRNRGNISKLIRRAFVAVLAMGLLVAGLFTWNGLVLAGAELVSTGVTQGSAASAANPGTPEGAPKDARVPNELRVVAFNIAKLFVHKGGASFDTTENVRKRLVAIAAIIKKEDPDIVFLSEVIRECTLCPVDQVEELAAATGLRYWAFGENFNFGLPFLRIVGGNAILSRNALEPVHNQTLAGRKAFYVTMNNRRALWCATRIQGSRVLLAAVHNDSFDLTNNLAQVKELLAFSKGKPAILAGDFNAEPHDASMKALQAAGRFSGAFQGLPTYPSKAPQRRIDYILGPKSWMVLEHRMIANSVSDHSAVFTRFRIGKQ